MRKLFLLSLMIIICVSNSKGESYSSKKLQSPDEWLASQKNQSPDEWLASQKNLNEKPITSKLRTFFGPTNAAECVQKYASKLKFSDALNLIYKSCSIGYSKGLNSKLVNSSKCIFKKSDDIYSVESGLKIINNCVKDIPYAFQLFADSLNETQESKISELIKNQISSQLLINANIFEDQQTKHFQIYDFTTKKYKYCYQIGNIINCQ